MKIKDKTIYFKSVPEMFYKERTGIKPNTVRILSAPELCMVLEHIIKKIHISETTTQRSFVRIINDKSWIHIKEFDINIFIFSWVG